MTSKTLENALFDTANLTGGEYTIQQKSSGRYLDAHESSAHDFSVVTRPIQTNNTQLWSVRPLSGTNEFTIQQKSNNRYLDAHESSAHDFSVVTRTAQNNNTQVWRFSPETLKVLSPNNSQDFYYDANDRLIIDIRFSHPVRESSVRVGETLVLRTDRVANANGTLTWSANRKTVKFTSQQSRNELLRFDPDGEFTLTLHGGTLATPGYSIVDDRGTRLDGNGDGTEGGNFIQHFIHIG